MSTLIYTLVLGILFLASIAVFYFFESPRKTIKKGLKKIKSIRKTDVDKVKRTLIVPFKTLLKTEKNEENALRVYMHEH